MSGLGTNCKPHRATERISRWRPDARVLDLFEMARKPPLLVWWRGSGPLVWWRGSGPLVWWRGSRTHARVFFAALSWCLAVAGVEASVGADIGSAAREVQERIELRIRDPYSPLSDPERPPPRTHEESIEPWELVNV